jgi:dipeptidyl aminopeptidase/acylaminoacyl peptidase
MRITGILVALAVLIMSGYSQALAQTPPRPRIIPTADFAKDPLVSRPILSPDGLRMVGRFRVDGRELVGIHSFTGEKVILIGLPAKQDLQWYRWAGNNRVLLSFAQTVPYFGEEAQATRLLCYDVKTQTVKFIGSKNAGLEGDDLLYVDPTGTWILLSFQKTIYDYPSVSRIELATNKVQQVVADRADVWEWYADKDGVVRIGTDYNEKTWSMVYRSSETEKFRKVGTAKYDDENSGYDIIRVAVGTDEGYVLSNKATGRYALYKFNYATKTMGDLVYGSATNDITDYDTTDDGKALRAVWYADDRDRIVWFDATMKQFQTEIDGALKENQNWILSRSLDDASMLIWTGAANNPGSYYLYRPAEGVMKRIARINDKVAAPELAPTKYITYKSRDGLEIPSYLTVPLGRDPKALPLIILPHGGPYGVRDKLEYSAEIQFLANRGYAVLQPNFRGSGGYGAKYYEKGEGQWGRQMQDDLDDGMDWLAKQGVIDSKRVCIVGSSYGGYAALWGATRNPERYRCAASFAGVSDLGRQLKYQIDFRIDRRYRKDWRKTVKGSPDFDTKTVSPLFTVDRLTVPVMLVHGDADQTVPYKQSKLYADALRQAGKPVEFYTYKDEGHGFSNSANLKDWLNRLEAFLAKHNPA